MPKININKGTPVKVEWNDAHWSEHSNDSYGPQPVPLVAVGHLVSTSEYGVEIALEECKVDNTYRLTMFIPFTCITGIATLKKDQIIYTIIEEKKTRVRKTHSKGK